MIEETAVSTKHAYKVQPTIHLPQWTCSPHQLSWLLISLPGYKRKTRENPIMESNEGAQAEDRQGDDIMKDQVKW